MCWPKLLRLLESGAAGLVSFRSNKSRSNKAYAIAASSMQRGLFQE